MYNYDNTNHNPCASSSPLPSSPSPQDEISLFLRQILLRSSSSPSSPWLQNAHSSMSSTFMAGLCTSNARLDNAHFSDRSSPFQDGISALDSSTGASASSDFFLSSSGTYSSPNMKGSSAVMNVSSSSFGVSENEIDEYDCESEVMGLVLKLKALVYMFFFLSFFFFLLLLVYIFSSFATCLLSEISDACLLLSCQLEALERLLTLISLI